MMLIAGVAPYEMEKWLRLDGTGYEGEHKRWPDFQAVYSGTVVNASTVAGVLPAT